MEDRSMVFGAASNCAPNMNIAPSYSNLNGPSLVMNGPPPFLGLRSMFNFKNTGSEKSFFCSFNQDENVDDDDDLEEYLHQPEKKRRLTVEQVQFLEKSFDTDNKLEPERKMKLAKELDLQPRQIAIWFQNRRARWKNKNLEKDYDTLKSNYDNLKADYDSLLTEKEKLQAEVRRLTDKMPLNDNQKDPRNHGGEKLFELLPKAPTAESVSTSESSQAPLVALKHDDLSSSKSGVFDSDSSHFADGVHSSFLETGDSSYIFECEQSNLSLYEEDNFSKNLLSLTNEHFKIQDPNYTSFPENPSFFGLPHDAHTFHSWPY